MGHLLERCVKRSSYFAVKRFVVEDMIRYEDTMDVNELIDFWDRSRDPADQWIVITDVYGGSVNNAFMERLGDDSLRLIAGMSLPLVLEVFSKLSTLDDAELAALVSSVRLKGTCLCSLPNSVEEDEDF